MPRIVVDVMLKPEILDPQGRAVQGALGRLGLAGVLSVRQGKRFEIEIEGELDEQREVQLEELAGNLLSNPVIEDWNLYLADEAGGHVEQVKAWEQPIDEPDLTTAQDQVVAAGAADLGGAAVPDLQPDPDAQPDVESVSDVASVAELGTVPDDVPGPDAQPVAEEASIPDSESESEPVTDVTSVPEVAPAANQGFAGWDDAQLRAGGEGQ